MRTTISKRTKYESFGGWRGRTTFVNSIAGANDTGTWDDSPCPSPVRKREVAMATSLLRKAGIRYRTAWATTSNVFSMGHHILVAPEDRQRAIDLLKPLHAETRLLWVEDK